jgi:hypothetical protein
MAPGWIARAVLGGGVRRRIHGLDWVPRTDSKALLCAVSRLGLVALSRAVVSAMVWRLRLRWRKATSSWCGCVACRVWGMW